MKGKTMFIIAIILLVLGIIGIIVTIFKYKEIGMINCGEIDSEQVGDFGGFIGGFFGTIMSIVASLLIFATYQVQSKELEESKKCFHLNNSKTIFFSLLKFKSV